MIMTTLAPNQSKHTPLGTFHREVYIFCRYEVLFRQSVGTEDVFLGMSGKTPATASCHHQLVSTELSCPKKHTSRFIFCQVRITLPATQLHEVELHVTNTFLDCSTPKLSVDTHNV